MTTTPALLSVFCKYGQHHAEVSEGDPYLEGFATMDHDARDLVERNGWLGAITFTGTAVRCPRCHKRAIADDHITDAKHHLIEAASLMFDVEAYDAALRILKWQRRLHT